MNYVLFYPNVLSAICVPGFVKAPLGSTQTGVPSR